MDALVTAAHVPSSVSGLRALGRAGLRVVAVGPHRRSPGLWSRYAAARALSPDPILDPDGFRVRIAELAERYGPLVVYPGQDEELRILTAPGVRLPEHARLPYPGSESVAALNDKGRLAELAAAVGLATPRTLRAGRAGELVGGELPNGAVVKPAQAGGVFPDVSVAESDQKLRELLATVPAGEELILQERLQGRLMALTVVVGRDGALVRRFQQLATRTWPEDVGISSLAVGVEPDEELAEAAASLLASAGYWGLAQLQFIDTTDGPRLIDVNTRYYGSIALALASGVDLPLAWHEVALDRPAGKPKPYRVGVTYRWLEADVIAAMRGAKGRLFARPRRPRVGPMWARDDPVASAMFTALAVSGPVWRRLRGTPDG